MDTIASAIAAVVKFTLEVLEQLCLFAVDCVALCFFLLLLVSVRKTGKALAALRQGTRGDIRATVCKEFFALCVDLIFLPALVVCLVCPWRAAKACKVLKDDPEEWWCDIAGMAAVVLADTLLLPLALLCMLTWRHTQSREAFVAHFGAEGTKTVHYGTVLEAMGEVANDVFTVLCCVMPLAASWRAFSLWRALCGGHQLHEDSEVTDTPLGERKWDDKRAIIQDLMLELIFDTPLIPCAILPLFSFHMVTMWKILFRRPREPSSSASSSPAGAPPQADPGFATETERREAVLEQFCNYALDMLHVPLAFLPLISFRACSMWSHLTSKDKFDTGGERREAIRGTFLQYLSDLVTAPLFLLVLFIAPWRLRVVLKPFRTGKRTQDSGRNDTGDEAVTHAGGAPTATAPSQPTGHAREGARDDTSVDLEAPPKGQVPFDAIVQRSTGTDARKNSAASGAPEYDQGQYWAELYDAGRQNQHPQSSSEDTRIENTMDAAWHLLIQLGNGLIDLPCAVLMLFLVATVYHAPLAFTIMRHQMRSADATDASSHHTHGGNGNGSDNDKERAPAPPMPNPMEPDGWRAAAIVAFFIGIAGMVVLPLTLPLILLTCYRISNLREDMRKDRVFEDFSAQDWADSTGDRFYAPVLVSCVNQMGELLADAAMMLLCGVGIISITRIPHVVVILRHVCCGTNKCNPASASRQRDAALAVGEHSEQPSHADESSDVGSAGDHGVDKDTKDKKEEEEGGGKEDGAANARAGTATNDAPVSAPTDAELDAQLHVIIQDSEKDQHWRLEVLYMCGGIVLDLISVLPTMLLLVLTLYRIPSARRRIHASTRDGLHNKLWSRGLVTIPQRVERESVYRICAAHYKWRSPYIMRAFYEGWNSACCEELFVFFLDALCLCLACLSLISPFRTLQLLVTVCRGKKLNGQSGVTTALMKDWSMHDEFFDRCEILEDALSAAVLNQDSETAKDVAQDLCDHMETLASSSAMSAVARLDRGYTSAIDQAREKAVEAHREAAEAAAAAAGETLDPVQAAAAAAEAVDTATLVKQLSETDRVLDVLQVVLPKMQEAVKNYPKAIAMRYGMYTNWPPWSVDGRLGMATVAGKEEASRWENKILLESRTYWQAAGRYVTLEKQNPVITCQGCSGDEFNGTHVRELCAYFAYRAIVDYLSVIGVLLLCASLYRIPLIVRIVRTSRHPDARIVRIGRQFVQLVFDLLSLLLTGVVFAMVTRAAGVLVDISEAVLTHRTSHAFRAAVLKNFFLSVQDWKSAVAFLFVNQFLCRLVQSCMFGVCLPGAFVFYVLKRAFKLGERDSGCLRTLAVWSSVAVWAGMFILPATVFGGYVPGLMDDGDYSAANNLITRTLVTLAAVHFVLAVAATVVLSQHPQFRSCTADMAFQAATLEHALTPEADAALVDGILAGKQSNLLNLVSGVERVTFGQQPMATSAAPALLQLGTEQTAQQHQQLATATGAQLLDLSKRAPSEESISPRDAQSAPAAQEEPSSYATATAATDGSVASLVTQNADANVDKNTEPGPSLQGMTDEPHSASRSAAAALAPGAGADMESSLNADADGPPPPVALLQLARECSEQAEPPTAHLATSLRIRWEKNGNLVAVVAALMDLVQFATFVFLFRGVPFSRDVQESLNVLANGLFFKQFRAPSGSWAGGDTFELWASGAEAIASSAAAEESGWGDSTRHLGGADDPDSQDMILVIVKLSLVLLWFIVCSLPIVVEEVDGCCTDDRPRRGSLSRSTTFRILRQLLTNLLYFPIVGGLIVQLACSETSNGPLLLIDNPNVECWTGVHFKVATMSVIALSFYLPTSLLFGVYDLSTSAKDSDVRWAELATVSSNLIRLTLACLLAFSGRVGPDVDTDSKERGVSVLIAVTIVSVLAAAWFALYSRLFKTPACTIWELTTLRSLGYALCGWGAGSGIVAYKIDDPEDPTSGAVFLLGVVVIAGVVFLAVMARRLYNRVQAMKTNDEKTVRKTIDILLRLRRGLPKVVFTSTWSDRRVRKWENAAHRCTDYIAGARVALTLAAQIRASAFRPAWHKYSAQLRYKFLYGNPEDANSGPVASSLSTASQEGALPSKQPTLQLTESQNTRREVVRAMVAAGMHISEDELRQLGVSPEDCGPGMWDDELFIAGGQTNMTAQVDEFDESRAEGELDKEEVSAMSYWKQRVRSVRSPKELENCVRLLVRAMRIDVLSHGALEHSTKEGQAGAATSAADTQSSSSPSSASAAAAVFPVIPDYLSGWTGPLPRLSTTGDDGGDADIATLLAGDTGESPHLRRDEEKGRDEETVMDVLSTRLDHAASL